MSDFIAFAQCIEEQCPKDLDCMLVKEHPGDCYIALAEQKTVSAQNGFMPGFFGSKPTQETFEWSEKWRNRRQQRVLDRAPFVFDYGTSERLLTTMLQGYPAKVKRIVFTDAEAWHVSRLQVGLHDQLEPGGVNASVLADNCQAMIERVLPGIVLTLTIRRAENAALTLGEVIFYGERTNG